MDLSPHKQKASFQQGVTSNMHDTQIALDPFNPGHYYACCGLLELVARKDTKVASCFDLSTGSIRKARFCLRTEMPFDLGELLTEVQDSDLVLENHLENSVRPVRLKLASGDMVLDWWLDWFRGKPENLKCWAGQVTTSKLIDELRSALPTEADGDHLFYEGRMMKTKFGIDPRAAWSALDVGFSPNEHNKDAATFPAVELLGAIGLQGFRPLKRKRDAVPYHLWQSWLGRVPARRAAVSPWDGMAKTSMEFRIAKRGQSYKYFTFAKPKGI